MSDSHKRVDELQARVSKTMAARYRASERLEKHQRLSLWTLAGLALSLVFIPLMQVYALLVGMEKFVAQTTAMRRSGVELDRLSRRIAARDPNKMTEAEYATLAREYFDIIDKYEPHQYADYQFTRLATVPKKGNEWPAYAWLWTRVHAGNLFNYIHYVVVLAFVAFIFTSLLAGIKRHADPEPLLHLRSSESLDSGGAGREDGAAVAPSPRRR